MVLIRGRRADIPVFGWAVTNYRGNLSSCGKLDSNFFMFNAPRAVHNQASRSVWVLGQAFNIVVRPDTPQFVVLDQAGVDMSNLCRARPHIPEPQKWERPTSLLKAGNIVFDRRSCCATRQLHDQSVLAAAFEQIAARMSLKRGFISKPIN